MMNRTSMARLLLLAGCLASTVGLAQERDQRLLMPEIPPFRTSQAMLPPELVLRVRPPEVPRELPVFQILPVEPGSLRDLPRALGLDGGQARAQDGKITFRGETREAEPARLTIFEASGGFFYTTAAALDGVPEKPAELPSEEQAHAAAMAFLRERGLLPQGAETDLGAVTFARPSVAERDKREGEVLQEFATEIEVRFPQRWGEYRVSGPGSKLYVALGEDGRVLSVTRMWREARATDTMVQSLQPEEALATVTGEQANATFPAHCATAEVTSFELVYWSGTPRTAQRIGLPVYRIQGTCLAVGGQDLGGFEVYAPAARGGPVGTPEREAQPVVDPDEEP